MHVDIIYFRDNILKCIYWRIYASHNLSELKKDGLQMLDIDQYILDKKYSYLWRKEY